MATFSDIPQAFARLRQDCDVVESAILSTCNRVEIYARVDHAERAGEMSQTAAKLHGLSDCIAVLDGSWTREQAMERMAARTRQYVKRQDTWARRWPGICEVAADPGDPDVTTGRALGTLSRHAATR